MVARIVVEVIKDPPLTAGVQWNTALETIDMSAKKLGYDMPFMGACPLSPFPAVSPSLRSIVGSLNVLRVSARAQRSPCRPSLTSSASSR